MEKYPKCYQKQPKLTPSQQPCQIKSQSTWTRSKQVRSITCRKESRLRHWAQFTIPRSGVGRAGQRPHRFVTESPRGHATTVHSLFSYIPNNNSIWRKKVEEMRFWFFYFCDKRGCLNGSLNFEARLKKKVQFENGIWIPEWNKRTLSPFLTVL